MKPSRYQWHRPLILAVCVLLAACSTVLPPEAGDDGGPKPIDLRKHMMEILEPDSLFRMRWASQIGDITDETLLVTSEVNKAQVYNSGGFQVRTLLGWKYCVSLVNPPYKKGEKARVGTLTVFVRNGVGYSGSNSCLWYEPTLEYQTALKDAIAAAAQQ